MAEKILKLIPAKSITVEACDNGFLVKSERKDSGSMWTTISSKLLFSSIGATIAHIQNELTQEKEHVQIVAD